MSTITLVLTPEEASRLYNLFQDSESAAPAYAEWQLRPEGCVITRYTSGKTVFQGKDADVYAASFLRKDDTTLPQAGSDEVGTGDYFGPVCVCACIADEKTLPLIRELGITDSKKMTDEQIREIAPQILPKLPHSLLIVPPAKYNETHESVNLNKMKALLHNQAYLHLKDRYGLPKLCVIDQFATPSMYRSYLKGQPRIVRSIHFETKAESTYPAVAAASVIARYAFLKEMDAMDEKWDMHFAKGSGKPADICAAQFVERYGFDALKETAKLHFKNTERLKGR